MSTPAYTKPLPVIDDLSRPYWSAAREHVLQLPKCDACGLVRVQFERWCPHCASEAFTWTRMSGRGKVWSFCAFHRAYFESFAADLPYNVGLVELDEGPRLMTNIVGGDPSKLAIGQIVNGSHRRRECGSDGDRYREKEHPRSGDYGDEHGGGSDAVDHRRRHHSCSSEGERDREHGDVGPRCKRWMGAGQGIADAGVVGQRDPHRAQGGFNVTVHRDQLDGGTNGGTQDSVLEQCQTAGSGDGTDNNQLEGGHKSVGPDDPGDGVPCPVVGRGQGRRTVHIKAGRPLLGDAEVASARKNLHVQHEEDGDNGYRSRLRVAIGLLDCDDDKRNDDEDQQQEWEADRKHRPRVTRSIPIPRPLPDAVHLSEARPANRLAIGSRRSRSGDCAR